MDKSKFYTIDELATLMHVNHQWVRKRIKERKIPFYKFGKQYFFNKTKIHFWIKEHEIVSE